MSVPGLLIIGDGGDMPRRLAECLAADDPVRLLVDAQALGEDDAEALFGRAPPALAAVVLCVAEPVVATVAALVDLHETPLTDWERDLHRYLTAPLLLARQAVEEFLAGGAGGRIVFVMAAPLARHAAGYHAAHTAVLALSRSITKEYGRRRIVANVATCDDAALPWEGLADAVRFLCSADASFVAGEVLHVSA